LSAARDLVAMRGTLQGVHRGTFAGIPATGRFVSAPLMIIYRIAAGRIAEHWMPFDAAAVVS
jgi:predicted ester cyclase